MISSTHSQPASPHSKNAQHLSRLKLAVKSLVFGSVLATGLLNAAPAINPITSKVHNVQGQFQTINDHGTASGFYRGNYDPSLHDHYQGIARHPTRKDIFFVSKSGDSASPAAIMGVLLSNEINSTHMNHNLWRKGAPNTNTAPQSTAYTYWEETHGQECDHFGGIQASGELLAVAIEKCGSNNGRIYLYDTLNTAYPTLMRINADGISQADALDIGYKTAGAVGIIEDSPGLYTIAAFVDGNSKLRFRQFRKSGSTLTATSSWKTFYPPSNQSYGWERGTGAHQSLNLVRQSDNKLYAIGFQRGVLQNDYMFLYEVQGIGYDGNGYLTGSPNLVYRAKRYMYCTNWESTGERMCDFQASAGLAVVAGKNDNSSGELTILASAHDDDKGPSNNVAPITEFRNRVVNVIDSSFGYCGHQSWATLYDDDHMNGDRNITITEYNTNRDDFKYLHNSTIDFGDKASAISYCIRPGCTLYAYKNSGYSSLLFSISGSGTGTYGYDNDLKRSSGGYYRSNWKDKGDKISSVRLVCN